MKNKKVVIIIVSVIAILALITGIILFFRSKEQNTKENKERTVLKTSAESYVAYVKINPSVKLNYSVSCNIFSDNTTECNDPIVETYELINDDAKSILKDVDLLADSKDLKSVIDLICEKASEAGIEVQDVSIQSSWSEINAYLAKEATNKNTSSENTNNDETNNSEKETINYSISAEVKSEDVITKTISEDLKEEVAKKAEEEKRANTIMLNRNVTYDHGMQTFECSGCFSVSLINTLKNAKGHYVKEATSSTITIATIYRLSDPYNTASFKGTSLISRIKNAGGEEVGGAGGSDEPLTLEVCKNFHLICE